MAEPHGCTSGILTVGIFGTNLGIIIIHYHYSPYGAAQVLYCCLVQHAAVVCASSGFWARAHAALSVVFVHQNLMNKAALKGKSDL